MSYPVLLPKTKFSLIPRDYNLSIDFWNKIDLYKILNEVNEEPFILHDGPPFANGNPHMGHAVNKIMKDIFNKMMIMNGKKLVFVPGWDCHGLPIESAVESDLKKQGKRRSDISIKKFRELCKDFANKWIDVQMDGFKKMGVTADFENPYKTMDKSSQMSILDEFHKFVEQDYVYRENKPVMWSCDEGTTLAEAEIEYMNKKSNAIYVAFKVLETSVKELKDSEIIIWTTTPWTLPANRAISYGDFDYSILEINLSNKKRKVVVAESICDDFLKKTNITEYSKITTIKSSDLKNCICAHPMNDIGFDYNIPLIFGEHVTLDQGTGLVHTAPSHGEEDFHAGKKYNLLIENLIDEKGFFTKTHFKGKNIKEVEKLSIEHLQNNGQLIFHENIVHSYPHSWRSRTPLIYRLAPQWFLKIKDLRERALDSIDSARWIPESGKQRFVSMLKNRPDWCISRQRVWGIPICIMYNPDTGEILKNKKVLEKIRSYVSENGLDSWWTNAEEISKEYPGYIPAYDILDVWFESGASQAYVLKKNIGFPADMYFEGSDQHRGWFQSSTLQSCRDEAVLPFKNLVTHGFVTDKQGRKMSKSLGNGVDPMDIIEKYGPDALRLWVADHDYTEDLKWNNSHLNRVKDIEKRLRNSIKFLIGNIIYVDKIADYSEMAFLEKWILSKVYEIDQSFDKSCKNFSIHKFLKEVYLFCTVDLSAFYFDIRKDTLYCDDPTETLPNSVRNVLSIILQFILKWLSPFIPFATEEAWAELGYDSSFFESKKIKAETRWLNKDLLSQMKRIRDIRSVVTGAIEILREKKEINSSLESDVTVYFRDSDMRFIDHITEICIISKMQCSRINDDVDESLFSLEGIDDVKVSVKRAEGSKCGRCKKILKEVDEICLRCKKVLEKQEC
ncbi:isoleucine--tRNA ligase [Candidatus Nesciobacter abundans]|uniref:Isoleucine--tRNA ligase n=1 Tax=Candidatus Nesciobacter abundans TaxID=2601668 RepID=A0A5C0UG07_9PROT|nr:isoleucine--tRNA ligase [Candidatus Nesciobacter abundans]QEK38988.1 isoleucine--tRNA ligase [Candidatus Nesciobacter abundans]